MALIKRYPGIKSFSTEESHLFFGREREARAIIDLISIRQTIVLYGKSGCGKSSLINAGVIPRLMQTRSCVYFNVRFGYVKREDNQDESPIQTVNRCLSKKIITNNSSEIDDLFGYESPLWVLLKKNQLQNPDSDFILFFDQFEELFSYPRPQIVEFSEQLAELVYPPVPFKFQEIIYNRQESGILSEKFHNFLYHKPNIKVVFAVRSDKLYLMNALTNNHPNILKNIYELNTLNKADAYNAISRPAAMLGEFFKTLPFTYTDAALAQIISNITDKEDGKIEAATLQIVCAYIEEMQVVTNHQIESITPEVIGNLSDIFVTFYEDILNKFDSQHRIRVQMLMEDELLENGKRNILFEDYIIRRFGLPPGCLDQLVQSSMLKKEVDYNGRIFYEISHDILIKAISDVATRRRYIEEETKARITQRLKEELISNEYRKRQSEQRHRILKATFFLLTIVMVIGGAFLYHERLKLIQNQIHFRKEIQITERSLIRSNLQQASFLIDDVKHFFNGDSTIAMKKINLADSLLHNVTHLLSKKDINLSISEENELKKLIAAVYKYKLLCQSDKK